MSAITKHEANALALPESEMLRVLESSLYPGAQADSIRLVLSYCKASGLDPMQKPVHIVPMWDSKRGAMRDVVMPGIGMYRTQAARSGECAGVSEPEFGPDVSEKIAGQDVTYPQWCRVTVKRLLPSGLVVDFTAKEFWRENYAVKGGKEKSIAPNAMWSKRPYGQIAKCAEAQALRKAFPEIGSQPVAEEMEGKAMRDDMDARQVEEVALDDETLAAWKSAASGGTESSLAFWKAMGKEKRAMATEGQKIDVAAIAKMADENVIDADVIPLSQEVQS